MANTCALVSDFNEYFEGPEKTLTLCFKARRLTQSLRLVPQADWEEVLKLANCEILSVIDSTPLANVQKGKKGKVVGTDGMTAYLLSESSLFVSDTTLTLKTCGQTTPLRALEALIGVAVPDYQKHVAEYYLKYATYMRFGYGRPEEQLVPHLNWEQEVSHLDKHFVGEATTIGSVGVGAQHVYVANYLRKGETLNVTSTQVALTKLDNFESLRRYAAQADGHPPEDPMPLRSSWQRLHGDNSSLSITAKAVFDERFFEPVGYSSNSVYGSHYTTVHATPQESCSYLSVETSAPLTKEARQQFACGASAMCPSASMSLTEFSLSPMLFSGQAPEVPGFRVIRSCNTSGANFACAHHRYMRSGAADVPSPASSLASMPTPTLAPMALPPALVEEELLVDGDLECAAVRAAEMYLADASAPKDEPAVLLDTGILRSCAERWARLLPRVEPFYAVKCNPQPTVLTTLLSMWGKLGMGGFDCASPAEMQLVLDAGLKDVAEKIIYANPCKQISAIAFARDVGVRRVVFDNKAELDKLREVHSKAELVLRVQTDDSQAQCPLSNKFGCKLEDCEELLSHALTLGMTVVGVSFHVGSGAREKGVFRDALRRARAAFDVMERLGFSPTLLDIGGGFPGATTAEDEASFEEHASDIRETLALLFPDEHVKVIAEPGRFFAASAQSLLTMVIAVADTPRGYRYYLNDGVYGNFNCLIYDHAVVPRPSILRGGQELRGGSAENPVPEYPCTLFGPTCDGFDLITDSMEMPLLRVGDVLVFENMGAYTSAACSTFNGFANAHVFVYCSTSAANE